MLTAIPQKRPGPPLSAASSELGSVMRGNDGSVYICQANKNGVQSWKRADGEDVTHILSCEEEARERYYEIKAVGKGKAAPKTAKGAAKKASPEREIERERQPMPARKAPRKAAMKAPRKVAAAAAGRVSEGERPVCRGLKRNGDPCTQTKLNDAGLCRFHAGKGTPDTVSDTRLPVSFKDPYANANPEQAKELDGLYEYLSDHLRTAYDLDLPERADCPVECGLLDSKAGGIGFLHKNEGVPVCGECFSHMVLAVQINLAQLSEEVTDLLGLGEEGLLQLYICGANNCCANWDPFSSSELLRVVSPEHMRQHRQRAEIVAMYNTDVSPHTECAVQRIIKRPNDFPKGAELRELTRDKPTDIDEEYIWEESQGVLEGVQITIGGWFEWIQHVMYPHCPKCGERMTGTVLNIGSLMQTGLEWDDCGTAQIYQYQYQVLAMVHAGG
ncbi:protein of unknown function DUF1963 [Kipferlia bialata]|uniref:Uncharacterized protein n=1 Tax=Kipferlia bialata TaxID=797122 RepID=A0A9K3GH87_9EUKA|nr:protein of unknown function DUF1963 [Kipferlia bialata]|eukprot:g5330.t1